MSHNCMEPKPGVRALPNVVCFLPILFIQNTGNKKKTILEYLAEHLKI